MIPYNSKKEEIRERLEEFRKKWWGNDKRVFAELAFCICTPQSRAELADKAVAELEGNGKLFSGTSDDIAYHLHGVRFRNNKARYIAEARKLFSVKGELKIKSKINVEDIFGLREWLAKNVPGLGYKEASHFLRNIGFGKDIAILDRHILKNLRKYNVISKIPANLSRKKYLAIEARMRDFSRKLRIPLGELDLLLWSEETGKIFK